MKKRKEKKRKEKKRRVTTINRKTKIAHKRKIEKSATHLSNK